MSNEMAKTEKPSAARSHMALLTAILIWSSTFISIKIILVEISPNALALFRYFLASALMIPVFIWRREAWIPRRDWLRVAVGGLSGMALYNFFQNQSLLYAQASEAAIFIAMSPVFMVLIAWLVMREIPSRRQIIGMAAALAGSILVSTNGRFTSWDGDRLRLIGDFLMLLTALTWAVYSVSIKELLRRYSPIAVLAHCIWAGTLFLLPTVFLPGTLDLSRMSAWSWVNLCYLGIVASGLAYLLWNVALPRVGIATAAVYVYLIPVLTALMAVVFLQERLTLYTVIGGGVVLIGTYLAGQ